MLKTFVTFSLIGFSLLAQAQEAKVLSSEPAGDESPELVAPFSSADARKAFQNSQASLTSTKLEGTWQIQGMALADAESGVLTSIPAGFRPRGVRHEDGSFNSQVKFEKTADDQAVRVTFENLGPNKVSQGPNAAKLENGKIQFKKFAYDNAKQATSAFEYTCVETDTPADAYPHMTCVVRFIRGKADAQKDLKAAAILNKKDKQVVAYYELEKNLDQHLKEVDEALAR